MKVVCIKCGASFPIKMSHKAVSKNIEEAKCMNCGGKLELKSNPIPVKEDREDNQTALV